MPLYPFLVVASILLALGLFVVVTRRHLIAILIGIELILCSASLNLVAFNQLLHGNSTSILEGHAFMVLIILLTSARVSVALSLCFLVFRNFNSADAQHIMTLKG